LRVWGHVDGRDSTGYWVEVEMKSIRKQLVRAAETEKSKKHKSKGMCGAGASFLQWCWS